MDELVGSPCHLWGPTSRNRHRCLPVGPYGIDWVRNSAWASRASRLDEVPFHGDGCRRDEIFHAIGARSAAPGRAVLRVGGPSKGATKWSTSPKPDLKTRRSEILTHIFSRACAVLRRDRPELCGSPRLSRAAVAWPDRPRCVRGPDLARPSSRHFFSPVFCTLPCLILRPYLPTCSKASRPPLRSRSIGRDRADPPTLRSRNSTSYSSTAWGRRNILMSVGYNQPRCQSASPRPGKRTCAGGSPSTDPALVEAEFVYCAPRQPSPCGRREAIRAYCECPGRAALNRNLRRESPGFTARRTASHHGQVLRARMVPRCNVQPIRPVAVPRPSVPPLACGTTLFLRVRRRQGPARRTHRREFGYTGS